METVVLIIVIVFAVLQIMLFFKLWGATNDIKKIKNYITGNSDPMREGLFNEVDEELYLGHENKALEILKLAQYKLESNSNVYSTVENSEGKYRLKTIVEKINEIANKPNKSVSNNKSASNDKGFNIGDFVTAKNNPEILYIDRINNKGEYVCMTTGGEYAGAFSANDLTKA